MKRNAQKKRNAQYHEAPYLQPQNIRRHNFIKKISIVPHDIVQYRQHRVNKVKSQCHEIHLYNLSTEEQSEEHNDLIIYKTVASFYQSMQNPAVVQFPAA